MKQIPKKIGLPETCILVQNFLRTYGFRKSAEMFSEESLSHQNKVVYKKEKKVKDLIDIINHYLCINVQEDVKTEIKNLTQKLQFLLHNYSSFRYSHKDSANLENFAISNKNAENNEENSKKDLKIKKRRKTTSPKKRHLKQNAKDHIKSSLLDRMITNEDFAVGLADAINKTKFENTLDDENPIDFDNLSFSQDYYGKVFNAMTEDQRIQKTLGGIVNVTSKDSVDFSNFLRENSKTAEKDKNSEKENLQKKFEIKSLDKNKVRNLFNGNPKEIAKIIRKKFEVNPF